MYDESTSCLLPSFLPSCAQSIHLSLLATIDVSFKSMRVIWLWWWYIPSIAHSNLLQSQRIRLLGTYRIFKSRTSLSRSRSRLVGLPGCGESALVLRENRLWKCDCFRFEYACQYVSTMTFSPTQPNLPPPFFHYPLLIIMVALWTTIFLSRHISHYLVMREVDEVRPTIFGSVPRIFEKAHGRIYAELGKIWGASAFFSFVMSFGLAYTRKKLANQVHYHLLRAGAHARTSL